MTKKDYIKLAQALKDSKPINVGNTFVSTSPAAIANAAQLETWKNTVMQITLTLQYDNSRFNRARFLAACGYAE